MKARWYVLLAAVTGLAQLPVARAQIQDGAYWKQNVTGGFVYVDSIGGAAYTIPGGPGWSANYAFRANRWLELEVGLQHEPGPVGAYSGGDGFPENAHDHLFLVPFGARFVWEPPSVPRFQIAVGAGGAYLNHAVGTEGSAFGVTSETDWGGQVAASAKYALTHSKRFQVGATARYYRFSRGYQKGTFFTVGPDFTFSF